MQELFERDYENKVCVECKTAMPSFVSINNAIIICKNCADKHKKLGYNISYIREIANDWDPYLLSYLERGGNSRFIRLSKKYDLDTIPIEIKFTTKIVEYYRLLIKSEVLADEPPLQIPFESAKEQIKSQSIYFPEFEKYELFEGKEIAENQSSNIINAFRFVGSGLGSLASYLGNKYGEYKIGDKLKNGSYTMFQGLKNAGNYIYSSSKPILKYASIKTVQGVGYLCKQAEYHLSGEEDNKEEKENNTEEGNSINERKKEVNNSFSLLDNKSNESSGIILQEGVRKFGDMSLMPSDFPSYSEINKDKNSINEESINNFHFSKVYLEDIEAPKPNVIENITENKQEEK